MRQAHEGLAAGTGLTSADIRQANQSAAMGMSARGLTGRQGVAAGVLSNYGLGLQRQQQARQFAGAMTGADQSLQTAALGMAGGAMSQYGAGGAFMGQANTMLGQYQPQIFQPESQMGTQAQGMQYQHGMGMAKAQMQQQQQLMQTMGSFGSFAAGGGFNGISQGFGGVNSDWMGRSITMDGGARTASGDWSSPIGPRNPNM